MDAKTAVYAMEYKQLTYNAVHLEQDLHWLGTIMAQRIEAYKNGITTQVMLTKPPLLKGIPSVYSQFIKQFKLNAEERAILILALQPHLKPVMPERIMQKAGINPLDFAEYGGVKAAHYNGMLPTGETVLFLLAGHHLESRIRVGLYFSPRHPFYTKQILKLNETTGLEPDTAGVLQLADEIQSMLTSGTQWEPLFNTAFPAKRISSPYTWDDLALNADTAAQLDELKDWLEYRATLLKDWGFNKHHQGGYKALFYGPPGTGKSLATMLLGQRHQMPVYRVDLSMVVSKYIGETEKNLSRIFDAASGKDWILFFDEADALFGKRTNIQSSNDRYANQEVAYLLMRMEEYTGLAILATNLKSNIDKAFIRRFQSVVYFGLPDVQQRLKIWEKGFPKKANLHAEVSLKALAKQYTLSGANILNAIRYSCMAALKSKDQIVKNAYIMEGIKRELTRESGIAAD